MRSVPDGYYSLFEDFSFNSEREKLSCRCWCRVRCLMKPQWYARPGAEPDRSDSSADICTVHIKNSPEFAAVAIHLLKEPSVAQGPLIAHRLLTCMANELFFLSPNRAARGILQHFHQRPLRMKYGCSFCFKNMLLTGREFTKWVC